MRSNSGEPDLDFSVSPALSHSDEASNTAVQTEVNLVFI
jgi:hypothetical protein